MARRVAALKPQLNRIRAWAHEGSTDAWIAHQLETTAEAVRAFRQEHGIERGGPAPLAPITPDSVVEAMLAEEAAALEAGPEPEEPELVPEVASDDGEPEAGSEPARAPRRRTRRPAAADPVEGPEAPVAEEPAGDDDPAEQAEDAAPTKPNRRRGARGGAGRAATVAAREDSDGAETASDETASDDEPADDAESDRPAEAAHDDEPTRTSSRKRGRRRGRGRGGARGAEARLVTGSVLVLDASVTADPVFQAHWQSAGPLRVEVGADTIVLRRAAAEPEPEGSDRTDR